MRRLTWMPLGLLVVLLGAGLAVHRISAVRVRDGFRKDLEAAKALVVTRSPLPQNPRHENGFECLGSMIDVTPRDLGEFVLDEHEHLVVKHDLFSHQLKDGKRTPEGIAEAFIEFAKKEKLSFFR